MPAGLREEEVSLRWAEPRSDSLLPVLIWRRSKGSQPGRHQTLRAQTVSPQLVPK